MEAEELLEDLDDSNTISSYKNERAARMIRRLVESYVLSEYYVKVLQDRVSDANHRIDAATAYLSERSQSNGVIPKALDLLNPKV